jgi:hypothetical protein
MKDILVVFLLLFVLSAKGQLYRNEFPCDKLVRIDSNEYKKNFIKAQNLSKTNKYKKVKNKITIITSDTTIVFKDQFEKDGYRLFSYSVTHEEPKRGWILVQQLDEQKSLYYLINLKTSKIAELLGIPKIYGDKIVCQEEEHTDYGERIQIWQIKDNDIYLYKTYPVKKCVLYNLTSCFLNKNMLYFMAESYFKLDITK